jgi:hypothetical protein
MKHVIYIISILNFFYISAQTEVFHDLSISHELKDGQKWKIDSELEWKHLYGEEGWSRTSIDFFATRELGVISFIGGLKNNYTFDNDIVNFWEIRPWIGVELENKLTKKLILKQELNGEFRNFFLNDDTYDFNFRTKFNVALEYPLIEKEEVEDWILSTEVEWFFLRNEEINERFINSREYSLLISKKIQRHKLLTFGIRLEEYSNNLINESEKAITFVVEFDL